MDIKVYKKEEVLQPSGSEYVYVPDVIDLIPVIDSSSGKEIITGCVECNDGDRTLLEQQCALATIWQRGLDPLDSTDGIQWSEVILGEVNVVELMNDLSEAVARVTTSVTVTFDVATDANGKSYFTYKLQEVA